MLRTPHMLSSVKKLYPSPSAATPLATLTSPSAARPSPLDTAPSLPALLLSRAVACKRTPPPPPREPPPPARPAPPAGPTRTDFATIAKKLVSRCVAGGWINEWRSKQPDVDVAKPKMHLRDFEDKTGQNLYPTYLNTTSEPKMRLSGVSTMAS